MTTLRILHRAGSGPDSHSIGVSLEGEGFAPQEFGAEFAFTFSDEEQEELRWYLEEYLQYPLDPAPKRACRAEEMMARLGERLFRAVFHADEDARDLWATLRTRLPETRVEVAGEHPRSWALPWELLRDPRTQRYLALYAGEFVRTHPAPVQPVPLPGAAEGPIRILLVIARPRLEADVPYRSVARRVVAALGGREDVRLDVLRPPTFEALADRLRRAKEAGTPYHVVHFDSHGMYEDLNPEDEEVRQKISEWLKRLGTLVLGDRRHGSHGYLLFENPAVPQNIRPVDGPTLGNLLVETGVPVLLLNACRSARSAGELGEEAVEAEADRHGRVRAFGSLAQEVMDAGVAGVVAMRYNVYVVTAARFVAELYAALARGCTLGQAVAAGRKHLSADPMRAILYEPVSLQDWVVPLVYEAAPIHLFPPPSPLWGGLEGGEGPLRITLSEATATPSASLRAGPGRGAQVDLPAPPDAGFFGRDETLLRLDRAFDRASVALLHGFAGSGKTTAAAEFARWYGLTGGLEWPVLSGDEGPALFTSFERYLPLPRVLDLIGRVFGPALENTGVHWLALDDGERRQVALQVLAQVPVLWIWDNVEPVTGFPARANSAWSQAEQEALAGFLRDLRDKTRAKVLLTSRRDERAWLGDLPVRIPIPPMLTRERVQLARALAGRYGRYLEPLDAWWPLLRFTGGNPLTLTVVVGQALRDGLRTREQIGAFVERLRAGEAAFADERDVGRSRSLGASLAYGFEHGFDEEERKQLALLHLFQGFVNVQVLRVMGDPDTPWCLDAVRGLSDDDWITLLDRAAEVGLLEALGGGYYRIHPAIPWFFRELFQTLPQVRNLREGQAERAYVEAVGALGGYYHAAYEDGNRDVIGALTAEEANLLHARRLARQRGWWGAVIGTMQGLDQLYGHTGRRAEWARLVEEIAPDFVDPATDGPLNGREEEWSLVTEYRVHLVLGERRWDEAERLQRVQVEWDRKRAGEALTTPDAAWDDAARHRVRRLGASLHELGEILRKRGDPACVPAYEEAGTLAHRIDDSPHEAITAFNLGHAYLLLPTLRDLERAEAWYRRTLELTPAGDHLGRARCFGQLGCVAWERFKEARQEGAPEERLLGHLNQAARLYHQALDLLPPDAVNDLAMTYLQLGNIYGDAGDLKRSLHHYREAMRYFEAADDHYHAAVARRNVAAFFTRAGRFADALDYARAARRGFETFGPRAAEDIQNTQRLIAQIEADMRG